MKKPALAATLAIAALSLSACTGGTLGHADAERAADSTPAPTTATSAPASADTEAGVELTGATPELQSWVEKKHDEWVAEYTETQPSADNSVYIYTNDAMTESAWVDNLSWRSPRCGEIVVTVKGDDWTEDNLDMISDFVLPALARTSPELQAVTAMTEDGETESVATRTQDDYLTEDGNPGGTCAT